MSSHRIVFAGTPAFGLPALEAIHQSPHELIGVYTQPDRPAGRGQKPLASPIKQWAVSHGVAVFQPETLKTPKAQQALQALKPDVMVVIAYGLILPQAILDIPCFGCLNVHASLLPRWRGASPIQQAILSGDKTSGITIMKMEAGLDTGPILSKTVYQLTQNETAGSLHDVLSTLGVKPLIKVLSALEKALSLSQPQDPSSATYAPKITKEEARINWHQPAEVIERQIRALNPWPIAFTLAGDQRIRIYEASIMPQPCSAPPGTLLDTHKDHLLISTEENCLAIKVLQFPGGKPLRVSDWTNSGKHALKPETVFQ